MTLINIATLKAELDLLCARYGIKGHLLVYLDEEERVSVTGGFPITALASLMPVLLSRLGK